MKRLLALLAVCIPLYLFAQGFGSFSHDQPFFAKDNASSGSLIPAIPGRGLALWWHAEDLSNQTAGVSIWTDRIQGRNLVQPDAAKRPFWTNGLGVNFFGSRWMQLTNTYAFNNNDAFLVVARPMTNTATYAQIVFEGIGNFGLFWINFFGGATMLQFTTSAGGEFGNVTLDRNYAFLYAGTNPPPGARVYTNGVAAKSSINISGSVFKFLSRRASAEDYFFNGRIQEIAVWTNVTVLSNSEIAELQAYLTNEWIFP